MWNRRARCRFPAPELHSDDAMIDIRELDAKQIDALREVANIGAGHAATALSQMTDARISVSVPHLQIAHAIAAGFVSRREEPAKEVVARFRAAAPLRDDLVDRGIQPRDRPLRATPRR